ncbi:YceD family protein [Marinobacter oulmenensis]|uniref:Large ribosomal RNA subunit accumulation protein YceD n=1 Tax=Marinobacter oulmenensis TaxID=643747 RepID=A0A840UI10_9GAMM|nr:YceD family protein [Marinobacter oulmenensis]MBB5322371.1 uncharacterized protein [Marinobacter oulmenensis]
MSEAPNAELPKSVDPYRLAEQGSTLEGVVPLVSLSRFRDTVSRLPEGSECHVSLTFGLDEERRRVVSGKLSATVVLECQRCMGDMQSQLESGFELGLVASEQQAQQLPKNLEPFPVEDFSMDVWTLVEDELLLALPAFPLHDRSECPATKDLEALEPDPEPEEPEAESTRENPFSVLAGLKNTKH